MFFVGITYEKLILSNEIRVIAVKNKFAQILTMMLRVEYPTMWPDFFHQLFRLLGDDEARQAGTLCVRARGLQEEEEEED